MQNGGPAAGWRRQSIWVCWAASRVRLEHMICPTAVAACCGSSGSGPSPLQRDGVNLSLLREGRPATEMRLSSQPLKLVAAAEAAPVCSLYACSANTQEQQRGDTQASETSVSCEQPHRLRAMGLTRLGESQ